MYATQIWLMHILDMETFYDHKSSQFIQAEDRLIVRLFHRKDLQNSKLVGTHIFIKLTWKRHILKIREYLFYDKKVSITIYVRDKL